MYIITYANTFLKLYTPLPNSFVTQKHHSSTELHIKTVWLIFTRILRSLYSDINRCVCVCVCVCFWEATHVLYILPRTYCFENTFTNYWMVAVKGSKMNVRHYFVFYTYLFYYYSLIMISFFKTIEVYFRLYLNAKRIRIEIFIYSFVVILFIGIMLLYW